MSYFVVTREAGPAWIDGKNTFEQPAVTEHAAYMNALPMASQTSQGPTFALTAPRLFIAASELPSFSPPGTLVLRI